MTNVHAVLVRRIGGFLAVALLSCPPLSADFHKWTSSGPSGGTILSVAVDPKTPSRLYCGLSQGGIYKSVDSGATWTSANSSLESATVNTIAIDPLHPDTVYVGTEVQGLVRTTDGGATWIDVSPTGGFIRTIVIDPVQPANVYVGTSLAGLFKSRDGGATWLSVNEGLGSRYIQQLAIDPSEPTHLFAATGEGGGIYRSMNGGGLWVPANAGIPDTAPVYALAVDPKSPATIYAGVTRGFFTDADVYKSTDFGQTWNATGFGGTAYAFARGPDGNLYAATDIGVWKTRNGIDHWASVNGDLGNALVYAVGIDPTTASVIHVGALGGVFQTSNGGTHWIQSDAGISKIDVYAVATDPNDPAIVYAGTIGAGVSKSLDAATTWAHTGPGLTEPFVRSLAIDPSDPATVFAVGAAQGLSGGVFRSTNGGAAWQATAAISEGSWIQAVAIDPASPQTIYAAGDGCGVSRSDDGGSLWSRLYPFDTIAIQAIAIDPIHTSTIYLATMDRQILKSTDRGETWSFATGGLHGLEFLSIGIDPTDPSILYAGAWSDHLLQKSTDGGASWTSIGAELNGALERILAIVVDPEDGQKLYVAGFGGVFRSENGGSSWTDMQLGDYAFVQALTLDGAGAFLHAGTWARGVMSYQLHFLDVTASHPFRSEIDLLAINGISSGCGAGRFCPEASLTRAQAAVWLLRAVHGSAYTPPPASGAVFADVPADAFAAAWIEQLASEGIASGCGGGLFCPDADVTRAQLAVWLLRAEHGPTYAPPPATGTVFGDVPADSFAAAWIEQLASEGITSGCGGGNFCPSAATTRAQSAVLLVRTFSLD